MKKKKPIIFLFFQVAFQFCLLVPGIVYAQHNQKTNLAQRTIKGKVTNEQKEPLEGVTIRVKNTSVLSTTDKNGDYLISAPSSQGEVLVYSMVGHLTAERSIGNLSTINISLGASANDLDEVVVIGYGTQSRELLTTSISKIDKKVVESIPYSNAASALQGTAPGVRVQSTSGQPGATPRIIVRGGTSIGNPDGATPLYVIDGITRDNMDHLSANDIESIQVLKDAASTSIYGARGSNGVVIVTTKSAKVGKSVVSYTYNLTRSTRGKQYEMAGAADYLKIQRLGTLIPDKFPSAAYNLSQAKGYGTGNNLLNNTAFTTQYLTDENKHKLNEGWQSMPDPIDPSKTLIFQENNMSDLIYQNAYSHNHHAEVSTGTDKAKFLLGLGYITNEGTVITTGYKRLSLNMNGEAKVLNNLSVTGRVLYSNSRIRKSTLGDDITFFRMAGVPPTVKIHFEDGSLAPGPQWGLSNPLYSMYLAKNKDKAEDLTISTGAEWNILPELTFRPQLSLYRTITDESRFMPGFWNGPNSFNAERSASASTNQMSKYQIEGVLDYIKTFGDDHNFSAMLGMNYTDRILEQVSAAGRNAATDYIPTLGASATRTSIYSWHSSHRMMGYFGRLNYNYQKKYMLAVNARYDGASNLGSENKWGFFPGISGGWHIDEEKFYSSALKNIIKAKLRASYGVNGNISGLGDFAAEGRYSDSPKYNGVAGIVLSDLPNQDLQWERSKTFDIGLDLKLWNDRISVIADYYRRVTDNLITLYNLPPTTGFGSILTNLGSLENRGLELDINVEVLRFGNDGIWNLGLNGAKVKNKILKLPENGIERNRIEGELLWDPSLNDYAWKGGKQEGETLGEMFAFQQLGVFATDQDAANAPTDMLITLEDKTKYGGDVDWLDSDNNGIIDSRDKVYMGNQYPTWTGGLSSDLSYGGFNFYVRADYTAGHTIFNWAKGFLDYNWQGDNNITQDVIDNSWKEQGDRTEWPRLYAGTENQGNSIRGSSRYYQKGDFLCFREITLSYSFSPKFIKKEGANKIRVAVTGNNLFYLTKYKGLNPEDGGTDFGRYAMPKNISFSANLTL